MSTTSKFFQFWVHGSPIDLNENLTLPATTTPWKIGGSFPSLLGRTVLGYIYAYIGLHFVDFHLFVVDVGRYTIHGWCGIHSPSPLEVKIDGKSLGPN